MDTAQQREEGIQAYRAGEKAKAQGLLEQVVQDNPDDAKAWYYLAGTYDDTEKRRHALQEALRIMPDNEQVQDELNKLSAASSTSAADNPTDDEPPASQSADTAASVDDADTTTNDDTPEPTPVSERAYAGAGAQSRSDATDAPDNVTEFPGGMSSTETGYKRKKIPNPEQGFELPVDIPGAPAKIDFQYLSSFFVEKIQAGVAILRRDMTVYREEIQRSTWWEFWGYVATAYLVIGIVTAFTSFMTGFFSSSSTSLTVLLTTTVLIPIIGMTILYAGVYASHWWVTKNRNGQGSLVAHAHTIAMPLITASLINNAISFVFSVLPFLLGLVSLVTLGISIYAWFIAVNGLESLHKVDRSSATWTVAVMIIAQLGAGFVLSIALAPFLASSILAAM